jgi:hypothetical protein
MTSKSSFENAGSCSLMKFSTVEAISAGFMFSVQASHASQSCGSPARSPDSHHGHSETANNTDHAPAKNIYRLTQDNHTHAIAEGFAAKEHAERRNKTAEHGVRDPNGTQKS